MPILLPAAAAHAMAKPSPATTPNRASRRAAEKKRAIPLNLESAFARLDGRSPRRAVACLNGHQLRLVKLKGPFEWQAHGHADRLFLVHRGRLVMEFRDRKAELREGELIIIPRGVEHRPVASEETLVLVIEPNEAA